MNFDRPPTGRAYRRCFICCWHCPICERTPAGIGQYIVSPGHVRSCVLKDAPTPVQSIGPGMQLDNNRTPVLSPLLLPSALAAAG